MCIIRFHARAGYLQHYETLLKEINSHLGSKEVPPDQYEVETIALADRNLNVPEMFVKSVYTVLSCVKHVV